MIMSIVRRGATALLACSLAAAVAGCGDGIKCESEILVVIQEPAGVILADANAAMDGIQSNVAVRTTLPPGSRLVLTVEDGTSMVLSSATAMTDSLGNATFTDVTVPPAGANLRVFGDAGLCGHDEDLKA